MIAEASQSLCDTDIYTQYFGTLCIQAVTAKIDSA